MILELDRRAMDDDDDVAHNVAFHSISFCLNIATVIEGVGCQSASLKVLGLSVSVGTDVAHSRQLSIRMEMRCNRLDS
jgi:hypothetical protein